MLDKWSEIEYAIDRGVYDRELTEDEEGEYWANVFKQEAMKQRAA